MISLSIIFDLLHKKFILKVLFFYVTRDYSKWAVRGLSITLPSLFVASLCCFQKVKNRALEKKKSSSCVWGSFDCCNKLPQTWWLKWQKYCLTVLRPEDWKSVSLGRNQGVIRVMLSSKAARGYPLPLPASGDCWHSLTCGHITLIKVPASSNLFLFHLLPLCIRSPSFPLDMWYTCHCLWGLLWII